MTEEATIGRIYEILKEKFGSMYECSKRTGIPQSTLSTAYQRGTVSYNIIVAMLKAMPEISPDWLLMGREPKYRAIPGEVERTARYMAEMKARMERQQKELDKLTEVYKTDISRLRNDYYNK